MNVLFVCTGNTCRSPMAEHLFRRMLADAGRTEVKVRSAGIAPAMSLGLPMEAASALAEEGVRNVSHRPSGLDRAAVEWADLILAMERAHRDAIVGRYPAAAAKTFLLKAHAGIAGEESIADPFGGSADEYRAALAEIKTALGAIVRNWTH